MNLQDYIARDKLKDISKGRYNYETVERMFRAVAEETAKGVERAAFEYCALMFLQELHYEFGFGKIRLERFVKDFSEKALAFDAGAYDMDDMRNALKEDVGIEIKIQWSGDNDKTGQ